MSDHWDVDQLIVERDTALAVLRRVRALCDEWLSKGVGSGDRYFREKLAAVLPETLDAE